MKTTIKKRSIALAGLTAFAILLATLVGSRDLSIGADTPGYARHYEAQASCLCFTGMEPGYEMLTFPAAVTSIGVSGYFTYLSLFIFLLTFLVISRLGQMYVAPKSTAAFVFMILGLGGVFLANPLYLQVHINAIRHGISALAVALFCLSLVQNKSKLHCLLWATVSILVHWSAVMYLPLVWVAINGKLVRPPLLIVMLHVLPALYLMGISEQLVEAIAPPLHEFVFNYGESALGRYGFGPRLDFALFTYGIAMLGIIAARRSRQKSLTQIATAAAISTVPFFLLGWGVFSNRYLFTPWILFSVLAAGIFGRFLLTSRAGPIVSVLAFAVGLALFLMGST